MLYSLAIGANELPVFGELAVRVADGDDLGGDLVGAQHRLPIAADRKALESVRPFRLGIAAA